MELDAKLCTHVVFSSAQPKVVTALDEAELARMLDELELKNKEVAGDSDEDDEDGESEGSGDEEGAEENGED